MPKFPHLSKGFWITLVTLVGALVLLVLTSPVAVCAPEKSIAVVSLSHLKSFAPALYSYANDHEGRLPRQLAALVPDYISEEAFGEARFRNDLSGRAYDWLYFPPLGQLPLPDDLMIAAAPATSSSPRKQQLRTVLFANGSVRQVHEADYQQTLKRQIDQDAKPSGRSQ